MYVVKWESSIIDPRIWDKSTLNSSPLALTGYKYFDKIAGF